MKFTHEQKMYLIEKFKESARKNYIRAERELKENKDGFAVSRCKGIWLKNDEIEDLFEQIFEKSLSSFYVSEAFREIVDLNDKAYECYYKAREMYGE